MTYNITRFAPDSMNIQLAFAKPFEISAGDILDTVTVYLLKELFMKEDIWGYWEDWEDPDLVK
jgi:hypothetical protein